MDIILLHIEISEISIAKILSQCWDNVYESSNPNEMWEQWKCTFLAIADKHAPLKTMRVRSRRSPWMSEKRH